MPEPNTLEYRRGWLRQCPFCLGERTVFYSKATKMLICGSCGSHGPTATAEEYAEAIWLST